MILPVTVALAILLMALRVPGAMALSISGMSIMLVLTIIGYFFQDAQDKRRREEAAPLAEKEYLHR